MNIGDAVRVKPSRDKNSKYLVYPATEDYTIGLIADTMEMDDGHHMYEVIFEGDRGWFSDIELEVISEN